MQKLSLIETVKGGLKFEQERFKKPDNCFYPVYWWLWNTLIQKDELKKQIDDMYEADIRAFMIVAEHPRFDPLIYTELSPAYVSDGFMELVKYAVDYGASKGMMIWLYDEAGWPSGSAGGLVTKENPKLGWKVIAVRKAEIEKGSCYQQPEDCLAAYTKGSRIASGYISPDGDQVEEYYLEIISDFFMDVAEPEAVERFLELTHERYREYLGEHLGNAVQLMFTDEPKNIYPAYTYDFAEQFFEKYGYDIRDHLPTILKTEGADDSENVIRDDYFTLCGELFRDRLLKKQHDWCEKNHILASGHMAGEHDPRYCQVLGRCNDVEGLRQMNLPGVDAIWRQITMEKPLDQVQIGPEASEDMCIPFFPRFASSAARMNGTNQAFSESFAVYGSGLTIDEMRYVLNYQTVRGINVYSFMNISYGRDKFYAYSQRPSFGVEKPGYLNLTSINQYTARLCYVNALGRGCVDTALYLSDRDLCAGGKIAQQACKAFYEMGIRLEKQGIQFDIIEDYGLAEAECREDGIKIGNAVYRHIYVPEYRYMPKEYQKKVANYLTEGTPICESSTGFDTLRVSKRCIEDGTELYFLYNESNQSLNTILTFTANKNNLYELNLIHGEIYNLRGKHKNNQAIIELKLEPGESRTYLVTDEEFATEENLSEVQYEKCIELNRFESTAVKEFVLNEKGGYYKVHAEDWKSIDVGAWKELYGEAFSGDIMYRTRVELPELSERPLYLDLGRVEHSARVFVNGQLAGVAAMSPKRVKLDWKLFKKGDNLIDIVVSNTAANQFVLSEAQKLYKPGELDRFHPMALVFEEQILDGGLYGPVRLQYGMQ